VAGNEPIYRRRLENVENLYAIFTEFNGGQYSPINELLYLITYSLFKYSPFGFHLASLMLHAANALLVFVCIKRLLEISKRFETEHKHWVAFLSALIFAIHPMNVESVAWISASKVLVYSFFYLLATLSFLTYLKNLKLQYYLLTLFLFACSFGGKEQAISFPLWMLLIYWLVGNSFKNKKLWFAVAPFLLLSVAFGVITFYANGGMGLLQKVNYPLWQRIVYACYSFTEYLLKLAFPFKLSYIYPFPSVVGEPLPQWILLYPLLLTILLFIAWKQLVTNKLLIFCLMFFGVHIAFTLQVISLSRYVVTADRYVYMASIGTCLLIAYYAVRFIKEWKGYWKTGLSLAFAAYLLYFGVYTNIRSRVWHDSDSLKKEIRELLKERNDYELRIKN